MAARVPPEDLPELPGVRFRDPALLARALTHRSTEDADNERLEFLGDAVLGLAIAAHLHETAAPGIGEGALTLARARVVSRQPLADAARALGLDAHVRLGTGEARAGGAQKDRILCGVYEAVVGAIFLDSGYAAAAGFAVRTLADALRRQTLEEPAKDPKNVLQERAQQRGLELPVYSVTAEDGPPHDRTFEVQVEVGKLRATGIGPSKKEATRHAAEEALLQIERFPFVLEEG